MLESISGLVSGFSRPPTSGSMSDSQRSTVQNTLAQFDPENLSEDDVQAIRATFRAEGIGPSADLKGAIEASGFDVASLRPQGGPQGAGQGHQPPPPDDGNVVSTLIDILEEYESQKLDEKSLSQIQDRLQEAGYSPRQNYISFDV